MKLFAVGLLLMIWVFGACGSVSSSPDAGDGHDGDCVDASDAGGDVFVYPDVCEEGRPNCCGNGVCDEGEEDCGCHEDCGDCYQILWKVHLDSVVYTLSQSVDGDLIGKTGEKLYAIDQDGNIRWEHELGWGASWSHPVLTPSGDVILLNGTDDNLYWLDLDGHVFEQQQFIDYPGHPHNGGATMACDGERVVLFAEELDSPYVWQYIMAYDVRSFTQIWSIASAQIGSPAPADSIFHFTHPTIAADGSLYFSGQKLWENDWESPGRHFYLLHYSRDGELLWSIGGYSSYDDVDSKCLITGPVLGPDDTVYFSGGSNHLRAFGRDGEMLWSVRLWGCAMHEPLVGPDGVIYISDSVGILHGISPDGQVLWRTRVGWFAEISGFGETFGVWQSACATPLLTADGYLVVPIYGHDVAPPYGTVLRVVRASDGAIAYDITDDSIWQGPLYTPLMDDRGVLYINQDYWIVAIQTKHTGMAEGYWVRGYGNARSNSTVTLPPGGT